jgi:hypothetical protein
VRESVGCDVSSIQAVCFVVHPSIHPSIIIIIIRHDVKVSILVDSGLTMLELEEEKKRRRG